jgi:hypothetical protein
MEKRAWSKKKFFDKLTSSKSKWDSTDTIKKVKTQCRELEKILHITYL